MKKYFQKESKPAADEKAKLQKMSKNLGKFSDFLPKKSTKHHIVTRAFSSDVEPRRLHPSKHQGRLEREKHRSNKTKNRDKRRVGNNVLKKEEIEGKNSIYKKKESISKDKLVYFENSKRNRVGNNLKTAKKRKTKFSESPLKLQKNINIKQNIFSFEGRFHTNAGNERILKKDNNRIITIKKPFDGNSDTIRKNSKVGHSDKNFKVTRLNRNSKAINSNEKFNKICDRLSKVKIPDKMNINRTFNKINEAARDTSKNRKDGVIAVTDARHYKVKSYKKTNIDLKGTNARAISHDINGDGETEDIKNIAKSGINEGERDWNEEIKDRFDSFFKMNSKHKNSPKEESIGRFVKHMPVFERKQMKINNMWSNEINTKSRKNNRFETYKKKLFKRSIVFDSIKRNLKEEIEDKEKNNVPDKTEMHGEFSVQMMESGCRGCNDIVYKKNGIKMFGNKIKKKKFNKRLAKKKFQNEKNFVTNKYKENRVLKSTRGERNNRKFDNKIESTNKQFLNNEVIITKSIDSGLKKKELKTTDNIATINTKYSHLKANKNFEKQINIKNNLEKNQKTNNSMQKEPTKNPNTANSLRKVSKSCVASNTSINGNFKLKGYKLIEASSIDSNVTKLLEKRQKRVDDNVQNYYKNCINCLTENIKKICGKDQKNASVLEDLFDYSFKRRRFKRDIFKSYRQNKKRIKGKKEERKKIRFRENFFDIETSRWNEDDEDSKETFMSDEKKLISTLLTKYENVGILGRPVMNNSQTIQVTYHYYV